MRQQDNNFSRRHLVFQVAAVLLVGFTSAAHAQVGGISLGGPRFEEVYSHPAPCKYVVRDRSRRVGGRVIWERQVIAVPQKDDPCGGRCC
jgi:hypothetical protein